MPRPYADLGSEQPDGAPLLREALDLLERGREERDVARAVDPLRDLLDLVGDGVVEPVDGGIGVRLLARVHDGLGERDRALAAPGEGFVQLGPEGAVLEREPAHEVALLVSVLRPPVDRDDPLPPQLPYNTY